MDVRNPSERHRIKKVRIKLLDLNAMLSAVIIRSGKSVIVSLSGRLLS
ncbi:hypothetical protein [Bradyrhizobium sp. HKCCYLS3013]